MMQKTFTDKKELENFKAKALSWANASEICCYFDSNNFQDRYSGIEALLCIGKKAEFTATANSFDDLQQFLQQYCNEFVTGYFGYDLKNQLEDLESTNKDNLDFPDCYFFVPEYILKFDDLSVELICGENTQLLDDISKLRITESTRTKIEVDGRFSRSQYIDAVNHLKEHIKRGDIYEVNFCQEFYNDNADLNPLQLFNDLNLNSPTPFASYFRLEEKYIISASPERFLKKQGRKLISQPIKGTAARNSDPELDERNKFNLGNDPKEKAENVMIVDLVRNDLTKSAVPGTVLAEELFGVYSFRQVFQMISTVVCDAKPELSNVEIIKNTFPMGSMTGAPKIEAMKLIDRYEKTKRGVFSGAIGYFSPSGDFDLNVVIRTILYNADKKYLSFQVGSAITFDADAETEYDECLLKAEAMVKVLKGN